MFPATLSVLPALVAVKVPAVPAPLLTVIGAVKVSMPEAVSSNELPTVSPLPPKVLLPAIVRLPA